MKFQINWDLNHPVWDMHNAVHLFGSFLMALVVAFWQGSGFAGGVWSYLFWFLWEIGDGFKPWYTEGKGKPWVVQQLCYSNYFSLQDAFIWNMGAWLGMLVYWGYKLVLTGTWLAN